MISPVDGKRMLVLVVLLLLAMCGCNGGSSSKKSEEKTGGATTAKNNTPAGIDLNCVSDRIQNPTEAFHYLYDKQSSNPVHEEADITPQTIDGSFKNNSGSQPVHGVRSDAQSWQAAWSGLMGIAGMSSAVALVKNGDATQRESAEKVNGYDTTKYSIDTARASSVEKGLYNSTLGEGGFEKGNWWITDKGCPVKIVLDSELHDKNGGVEKIHYEEEMVRK